jgi:HlyD family secretion protein
MKPLKIFLPLLLIITVACNDTENAADAWGNFETRETMISAQVNGKLIDLLVEKGEILEKDMAVGMIDTLQYALGLQRLLAQKQAVSSRINDIRANISVMEAQKSNLEREINRTRNLLADKAATQQQLDDLEGKLLVTDKQIQAAQTSMENIHHELQAMDSQIAIAAEQLSQCTIINPLQGTVLEKYAETFELIMPGKPLYKIADLSVMDLKVYVSGGMLPYIGLGQNVKVFIDQDADTNRELQGTVNWISSRAEFTPKTIQTKEERINQVYAVKISVPNDGAIKIGMPGEVIF